MATAIFNQDFNYSSRLANAGWSVKASPKPQTFPRELIDAAIAAGVAKKAKPLRKETKTAE